MDEINGWRREGTFIYGPNGQRIEVQKGSDLDPPAAGQGTVGPAETLAGVILRGLAGGLPARTIDDSARDPIFALHINAEPLVDDPTRPTLGPVPTND